MTFEELVTEVCERLNLSSDEAKSRVGREINARYRRITSSIGLETSRRVQVVQTAVIGNPIMTFTGIEKVIAVIDKSSGKDMVLKQVTRDELYLLSTSTSTPHHYAVTNIHTTSVDILLDCIPTTTFLLYADGHTSVATLAGSQSPNFPESFHDILIYGAIADEYRKMEKVQLYKDCELEYEGRLSDLRMWIAKSGYLDTYQGKHNRNNSIFPLGTFSGGGGGGGGSTSPGGAFGTAALGAVLISQGVGVQPIWGTTPLISALEFNFSPPSPLVDGMVWLEVSGTSPARIASLKFRDAGVTHTLASITY